MSLPYRAEAVGLYLEEQFGEELGFITKRKHEIAKELQEHNSRRFNPIGRLTGRYKQAGEQLRELAKSFEVREKEVLSRIDGERAQLNNPENFYDENCKVNKLVDKLAREKDPQYRVAAAEINLEVERITMERQECSRKNGL